MLLGATTCSYKSVPQGQHLNILNKMLTLKNIALFDVRIVKPQATTGGICCRLLCTAVWTQNGSVLLDLPSFSLKHGKMVIEKHLMQSRSHLATNASVILNACLQPQRHVWMRLVNLSYSGLHFIYHIQSFFQSNSGFELNESNPNIPTQPHIIDEFDNTHLTRFYFLLIYFYTPSGTLTPPLSFSVFLCHELGRRSPAMTSWVSRSSSLK